MFKIQMLATLMLLVSCPAKSESLGIYAGSQGNFGAVGVGEDLVFSVGFKIGGASSYKSVDAPLSGSVEEGSDTAVWGLSVASRMDVFYIGVGYGTKEEYDKYRDINGTQYVVTKGTSSKVGAVAGIVVPAEFGHIQVGVETHTEQVILGLAFTMPGGK